MSIPQLKLLKILSLIQTIDWPEATLEPHLRLTSALPNSLKNKPVYSPNGLRSILIMPLNPSHGPGKRLFIPPLRNQIQRCVHRIQNLQSTIRRIICLINIIPLTIKNTKPRSLSPFPLWLVREPFSRSLIRTPRKIQVKISIVG